MTDTNNIKEVMLFPAMKPNENVKVEKNAASNEQVKLYVTDADQYLVQIVASLAGTNLEVVRVGAEEAKKSTISFPYIKTAKDETIFEASAIAAHLARMNPASGLSGVGAFQEASVNQWVAWSECLGAQVSNVVSGI